MNEKKLTFPVLLTLWVTLSSSSDNLGSKPGIDPPVARLQIIVNHQALLPTGIVKENPPTA